MKLQTTDVTKHYGDLVALDGIDWGIDAGGSEAIIGPNGAGKTTFFNVLAGITEPTSGSIELGETDVTGESPHRRARRGLVKSFQQTSIYTDETVYENVRIAAQMRTTTFDFYSRATDLAEVNERTEAVLERINVHAEPDEPVENLPYGERRKIEIGIALATEPNVLLLDEPTAGMSQDGIDEIIGLLEELIADPDLTVVLTEHNIDLVLDLVDEITVFNQGSILSRGSSESIVTNDDVQRVYLGTDNA